MPPEIRDHEPREARDGGEDGLAQIRRLISQAPAHLAEDGALVLEVGLGQARVVLDLLAAAFPTGQHYILPDLGGVERATCVDCGGGTLPRGAILH